MTRAGGFNMSWQRHAACYALAEPFLPAGRVLDLGCGIGHSYDLLAPRDTVGLDCDAHVLDGQDRETVVADMRRIPFPTDHRSHHWSPSTRSSMFRIPERVLTEVVRVLEPEGCAAFATPNRLTFARPDEIIDPYHYVEYYAGELAALCRPVLRRRSRSSGSSARRSTTSSRAEERREARPHASPRPVPAAEARCRDVCGRSCTTGSSRARGATPTLVRLPSASRTSALREGDVDEAVDLVAVCRCAGS